MSNKRYRSQFRYSMDGKAIDVFARVTFGASGAPTIDAANSVGISNVTRNSAGDYTIKFTDQFVKLRMIEHLFDTTGASGAAPASPDMWLKAQSVNTSGGGTVRVVFNSAGTATDPASGEAVLLWVAMNDSSVTL